MKIENSYLMIFHIFKLWDPIIDHSNWNMNFDSSKMESLKKAQSWYKIGSEKVRTQRFDVYFVERTGFV